MQEHIEEYTISLPTWKMSLTVLLTLDGPFFSIREFCRVLGVADVQSQVEQLRDRRVMQRFVRQYPVSTRGGRQLAWCIHRRAVGFWLASINEHKIRADVQDRLIEFQEEVLDAADRLFFGEVASEIVPQQLPMERTYAVLRQFSLDLEARIGTMEDRVEVLRDTVQALEDRLDTARPPGGLC